MAIGVSGIPGWTAPANAQPQPPHRFFGTVSTADGEAVTGATVEVVYRGRVVVNDTTDDTGYYDLKVPADEIDADENRTLVLTVRDASKRRTFESGGSDEVNFVVKAKGGGGGTATPTETPTSTETPTETSTTFTSSPTGTVTQTTVRTTTETQTVTVTPASGGTGGEGSTNTGEEDSGVTAEGTETIQSRSTSTDSQGVSPTAASSPANTPRTPTNDSGLTTTLTASPTVESPPTRITTTQITTTATTPGFDLIAGIIAILATGLLAFRQT